MTHSRWCLTEWERVLRTNLTSAFLMSRRAIPGMKKHRRGVIVMNSSVGNFIAATRSSAYGASKAGMMALARGLALEGAPYGIRTNAVYPGVIDAPMNERNLSRADDPEAMRRSWYEVTPLCRLGPPATWPRRSSSSSPTNPPSSQASRS